MEGLNTRSVQELSTLIDNLLAAAESAQYYRAAFLVQEQCTMEDDPVYLFA